MFDFKKYPWQRIVILLFSGVFVCGFAVAFFSIFSATPPAITAPVLPSSGISESYEQRQIDRILANPATDGFCFDVLSDSHVNPDNGSNSETLKTILKDIDNDNCFFAIAVGDLVAGGTENGPQFFYDIIKNEKTPFLTAVGNHDIERDGGKNYLSIFGNFYYSFSYGNSLFIVAGDASESMVTQEQVTWLESQLQKNYQHKFVFMHIPFYDPRPNTGHDLLAFPNGGLKAVLASALMEKYKPDIVFFGHIHAYYNWTKNGVEYITTGGAGGNAVGNDPQHDFHNYIKVDVKGDKVEKQVIKIP